MSNSTSTNYSTNNSITINSLHSNYYYNLSVSGVTISSGPFSQPITFKTNEASMFLLCVVIICNNNNHRPSSSPNILNATVNSPYSAVLTWAPPPPAQQNGIIIVYIINVTILETNETFLLFSNTTSLTVNGLRPFRNYVLLLHKMVFTLCPVKYPHSTYSGYQYYSLVFLSLSSGPSAPPFITFISTITSNYGIHHI